MFKRLRLYLQQRWYRSSVRGKSFWDWLGLLLVPMVLGGVVLVFEGRRADAQRQEQAKRAQTEREIADDRFREETLRIYFDRMADLMLREGLLDSQPDSTVRDVARARTLAALRQLDGERKGQVVRFVREASMIESEGTILDLSEADLTRADLVGANLTGANLSKADLTGADLVGASLTGANLARANLTGANLSEAYLSEAYLANSNLTRANLAGAVLGGATQYDLTGAYPTVTILPGANLAGANLTEANLTGAFLTSAKLTGALVTPEQLAQAKSLKGVLLQTGVTSI
jgi:hypothetical protein